MKHILTAAALAGLTASPVAAQFFIPDSGVEITPLENGVRIAGTTGHGARGTWCVAAHYALNELGARGNQQLYVKEPRSRGTGRNSATSFTLDPTGLTPSSVLIVGASLNRPGASLTVNHALTFCADLRLPSR